MPLIFFFVQFLFNFSPSSDLNSFLRGISRRIVIFWDFKFFWVWHLILLPNCFCSDSTSFGACQSLFFSPSFDLNSFLRDFLRRIFIFLDIHFVLGLEPSFFRSFCWSYQFPFIFLLVTSTLSQGAFQVLSSYFGLICTFLLGLEPHFVFVDFHKL